MELDYKGISKVLKALSDPKRLRIIYLLAQQKMGASALLPYFNISQPTLSHDMRILQESGLVIEERIGKNVNYELDPKAVANLITVLQELTCQQEDR